jgi:tetratricopeptide (TPR) repeat protein
MGLPAVGPLITDVLDLARSSQAGPPRGDLGAWQAFAAAQQALTARVEGDATALGELTRLVTADHELTPDEIARWLEYIWAHLVNKYQGTLAEYMAARELGAWLSEEVACGRLGEDVLFVAGDAIRERGAGAQGDQWLRGADGLLLVGGSDEESGDPAGPLGIVGVVEVKSFPATFVRNGRQIGEHISRLRCGLALGEKRFAPAELVPVRWDSAKGWEDEPGEKGWESVLRVLVSPRRSGSAEPAIEHLRTGDHRIELPVSRVALAATAYQMTVLFLERVGARAFAAGSPWPEMTAEEAGVNAVKEALYHILYEGRAGSKRATRIATRLYNVYGFGYVAAQGQREMLWADSGESTGPEDAEEEYRNPPPADASLAKLAEGAWHHYREGDLDKAKEWAQAAIRRDPQEAAKGRAPYLLGMVHYHLARFQEACELLPEPGPRPSPDDGRWAKDMIALARANARSGRLDRAQALIDAVSHENLQWTDLPVALPIAEGWVAIGKGDRALAEQMLERGCTAIDGLLEVQKGRKDEHLGDPPHHDWRAVQIAIVDAAALMATLGQPERALELIRPLTGLPAPLLKLVEGDRAFRPLREDPGTEKGYKAWLKEMEKEEAKAKEE